MLIGHFGLALGIKRFVPKINLGVLTAAAVLSDVVWCVFLLLGLERSEIAPRITQFSSYNMNYVPWSHGLDTSLLWAAVVAALARLFGRPIREAIWLGVAVTSHWVLDVVTHRPDMPVLGDRLRLGLSLYNSTGWTMVIEITMLLLGAWLYLGRTAARNRKGGVGIYIYLAALLYVYIGGHFSPPPSNIHLVAVSGIVTLSAFALFAAGVDHYRLVRKPILSHVHAAESPQIREAQPS